MGLRNQLKQLTLLCGIHFFLQPPTSPHKVRRPIELMNIVKCEKCGTGRWENQDCRHCLGMDRPPRPAFNLLLTVPCSICGDHMTRSKLFGHQTCSKCQAFHQREYRLEYEKKK